MLLADSPTPPTSGLARLLAPGAEPTYAALRILTGLLFAFHGLQGLFGILLPFPTPEVGSQAWIGSVIELVTGVGLAAGLLTRWAGFLASGTMAVAYIQFHWKLAFDAKFFPAVNQGEPALVYAFLFLYIACRGPGRTSLDRLLERR